MAFDSITFAVKMKRAGISDSNIRAFIMSCSKIFDEEIFYIREKDIAPADSLIKLEDLPSLTEAEEHSMFSKCAVLKLNGGLATTIGLEQGPKSLIKVRDNMTFLDIVMEQLKFKRKVYGAKVLPLILMNSFNTSDITMSYIGTHYPEEASLVTELLQSRVPRIDAFSLEPYVSLENPHSEWCPPGHGDMYMSFYGSSLLASLLSSNIRYVFVSNIDNLGAVTDMRIPAWMEKNKCPFLMEVARRCAVDKKGGHLALNKNGCFVLRESGMCAPEEREEFGNIEKYKYFNTNNIWFDVKQMYREVLERNGYLDLPVIRNTKKICDNGQAGHDVYQLETACGSAISVFKNAVAMEVPRTRFAPVKNIADLLTVRSDASVLNEDYSLTLSADRYWPPIINLPKEVDSFRAFEQIFPYGAPSLIQCESLKIEGPVIFGKGISCVGKVSIKASNRCLIPDNSVLSGDINF